MVGALGGLADAYRRAGRWADAARTYKRVMDRHKLNIG
jgi:hypothetical protein